MAIGSCFDWSNLETPVRFARSKHGDKMKKILTSLVLALASSLTFAAGSYDGIYQSQAGSTGYYSFHQNGSTLIVAYFDTIAASGVNISSAIGNVVPTNLSYWSVMSGQIVGNRVTLTGQTFFATCNETTGATFESNGTITITLLAMSATPAGLVSGVNCTGAVPIGSTKVLFRVF